VPRAGYGCSPSLQGDDFCGSRVAGESLVVTKALAPANAFAENLGALGLAPAPRFFVPFSSTALGF
jgi:hypothetical protein